MPLLRSLGVEGSECMAFKTNAAKGRCRLARRACLLLRLGYTPTVPHSWHYEYHQCLAIEYTYLVLEWYLVAASAACLLPKRFGNQTFWVGFLYCVRGLRFRILQKSCLSSLWKSESSRQRLLVLVVGPYLKGRSTPI